MQNNPITVPVAIVLAGVLIAGAILIVKSPAKQTPDQKNEASQEIVISPITEKDYTLGNVDAPIKIVVFSDTECPYCQRFHATMRQVVNTYQGKVAMVFRHLPFHEKAPKESAAAECAGELGGNDAFWKYLDAIFDRKDFTKSPYTGIDPKLLPTIAKEQGLDEKAFEECLSSGRTDAKVKADYEDGIKAGGKGTPYSVIFVKNQKIPINEGALPFAEMKNILDTVVKEL